MLKHNTTYQQHSYKLYCDPPLLSSFFCSPVDQNELTKLILKLKDNKSPGPDNIGSKLIKDNIPVIINPFPHLFNLSISSGIVPDKLKLAKVVPVYKNKGETFIPCNYQPISLLSVLDKLFEKVMYARLYSYPQAHNILDTYQFGFRKKNILLLWP